MIIPLIVLGGVSLGAAYLWTVKRLLSANIKLSPPQSSGGNLMSAAQSQSLYSSANLHASDFAIPDETQWPIIQIGNDVYKIAPRAIGPLTIGDAFRIANENGWTIPTRAMADAIWQASDLKVLPHPMATDGTTKTMMGNDTILKYKAFVENQIAGQPYKLLGGDHKDIVSENGKHGIYGWFVSNNLAPSFTKSTGIALYAPVTPNLGGKIIQQYPSPHDDSWGDYSQYLYPIRKVTPQS